MNYRETLQSIITLIDENIAESNSQKQLADIRYLCSRCYEDFDQPLNHLTNLLTQSKNTHTSSYDEELVQRLSEAFT